MKTIKSLNKSVTASKNPSPANRSLNKSVTALKKATPTNKSLNKSVQVSPSK